jgi:phosphoglucosamine mutase
MGKLFGTDGIRGVANQYPMTPETVLQVGRAVAHQFADPNRLGVVIGKDTRLSGDMIESALISGICSMGINVLLAAHMPTPGVAYLTAALKAAAGVVVSASHNPYVDNGIKVFNGQGFKVSDADEAQLEARTLSDDLIRTTAAIRDTGQVTRIQEAENQYMTFLKSALKAGVSLEHLKLVIDCSNGATFRIAPLLFSDLGAQVTVLCNQPNGKNINDRCGSQHPEFLSEMVANNGADIGVAFDGDGDRLIAVDETGAVLTGDQTLAVCAKYLKQNGRLKNNTVVSTVMSNIGLRHALKSLGIRHVVTDVGDRYVMQAMVSEQAVLGGEESGHTVFLDHQTTGDGLLTALKLLEVVGVEKKPLSELKKVMTVFPQVLINVTVQHKPELASVPEVQAVIRSVESALAGKGRVLVRYSGTQPQCRVMVEGPTETETRRYCEEIAKVLRETIGSKDA